MTRHPQKIYNIFQDDKLLSKESNLKEALKLVKAGDLKKKHVFKILYKKPTRVKFVRVDTKEVERVDTEPHDVKDEDIIKKKYDHLEKLTEEEMDIISEYVNEKDYPQGILGQGAQGSAILMMNPSLYGWYILKILEGSVNVDIQKYTWLSNHPVKGVQETLFISSDGVALGLEFIDAKTLYDIKSFTDQQKTKVATQLNNIIANMHKNGIYHLDLKPDNILIDNKFNVTVIDLGVSAIRDLPETWFHRQGSILVAPPVINPITGNYISSEYSEGLAFHDQPQESIMKYFEIIDRFGIIVCLLYMDNPTSGGVWNLRTGPEEKRNAILSQKDSVLYPIYKKFFENY